MSVVKMHNIPDLCNSLFRCEHLKSRGWHLCEMASGNGKLYFRKGDDIVQFPGWVHELIEQARNEGAESVRGPLRRVIRDALGDVI